MSNTCDLPETVKAYFPEGVSTTVTPEEIAALERILHLIDVRNQHLANVSQWLILWDGIRDLCNRFSFTSHENRAAVATAFHKLLTDVKRLGIDLQDYTKRLSVSPEHFYLVTNCEVASFESCITFLHDRILQWFDCGVSDEIVESVWASQFNERNLSL